MNSGEIKRRRVKKAGALRTLRNLLSNNTVLIMLISFLIVIQIIMVFMPGVAYDDRTLQNREGAAPAQILGEEDDAGGHMVHPVHISPSIEALVTEKEDVLFIMGEHNGRLAILSPDRKTVYDTLDVYIGTLPEHDRALLLEGIEVRSAEQLYSLIEDYSS